MSGLWQASSAGREQEKSPSEEGLILQLKFRSDSQTKLLFAALPNWLLKP
jgi:hypothetical protein